MEWLNMSIKLSVLTPTIRPQYLKLTEKALEKQTHQKFEWLVEKGNPSKGFTLPSDLNKLLKRATGDVVVMLQDCIEIDEFALADIAKLDHKHFYTFPVGKRDGDSVHWDWRASNNGKITPNMWEADFGCGPLQGFYDVGGYDEDFNNGWSWENVEIAWRLQAAGYKFYCEPSITGIAIDHDKEIEHPFRNKKENNDKRAEATRKRASRGDYKLTYVV